MRTPPEQPTPEYVIEPRPSGLLVVKADLDDALGGVHVTEGKAEPTDSETPYQGGTALTVLEHGEEVNGEFVHHGEDVTDAEVVEEPDLASSVVGPSRVRRPGAADVPAEEAVEGGDRPEVTPRFGHGGLSLSPISLSRPGATKEPGRNRFEETEYGRPSEAERAARDAARRQGVADLTREAEAARQEYARLSAGRANRRHFKGKNEEFGKEAVAEAKKQYKERAAALKRREQTLARHAGVSQEDLTNYDSEFATGEAKRLMNAIHRQRLVATGRFIINAAGQAERRPHGQFFVDAKGKAHHVDSLPREDARRHLKPRSQNERHLNKLRGDLREALYDHGHAEHIGVIIDGQTENEVHLNRRRMLGAAAVGAAGRSIAGRLRRR